jgi:hypothetical protein
MIDCPERLLMNDLVAVLLEQAERARDDWLQKKGTANENFSAGIVQGYWQVITSLKSRVEIYGVEFENSDLTEYEPDEIWR